ncbi:MAG TPA: hypothetical protein VGG39_28550 [Polyangiaceae bacterium]|jgi:hypothetical protein
MNTTAANPTPPETDDVTQAIDLLLVERRVPAERAASIRASIAGAGRDEHALRRNIVERWRNWARLHGVNAAAKAAGLSRHAFLMVLADLQEIIAVYHLLHVNYWRGEQLDEDAAARLVKGAAK